VTILGAVLDHPPHHQPERQVELFQTLLSLFGRGKATGRPCLAPKYAGLQSALESDRNRHRCWGVTNLKLAQSLSACIIVYGFVKRLQSILLVEIQVVEMIMKGLDMSDRVGFNSQTTGAVPA